MSGIAAFVFSVTAPYGAEIDSLDDGNRVVGDGLVIGRVADADIRVRSPMIGGRRNSRVAPRPGGGWEYQHFGHSLPCFHNDSLFASASDRVRWLAPGDVFGPVTTAGDRIGFLFAIDEESRTRSEVLPTVERAIDAAFPDRAEALRERVAAWFPTEPLVTEEQLARVLHCSLCGAFRRFDEVVEIEAFGPVSRTGDVRFQVIADAGHRLAEAASPAMSLCERCLSNPTETLAHAANADIARTDIARALEAASAPDTVRAEVDRRFHAAQPRFDESTCALCGTTERVLSGRGSSAGSADICPACLTRASAVRLIRG